MSQLNPQFPPYDPYGPPKPFVSAHSRAQTVTVLLSIGIIAGAFSLLFSLLQLFLPVPTEAEEVSTDAVVIMVNFAQLGSALVQFVVYIATIVYFLMWLYRCYENLPAFGFPRRRIKYTSGWAVGSFFVPFVNLVVPYRAVCELWRKSVPHASTMFGESSPPSFFAAWWGFWLVSNFANQIYFRMVMREDVPSAGSTSLEAVTTVLDIVSAILAIMVVREIDRQQTESSRLITPHYPFVPPPPPSFGPVPPAENARS